MFQVVLKIRPKASHTQSCRGGAVISYVKHQHRASLIHEELSTLRGSVERIVLPNPHSLLELRERPSPSDSALTP